MGLSGALFLFSNTNVKTEVKDRTNEDESCQPHQKKGKKRAQMHLKIKYGHSKILLMFVIADYMTTAGNYRGLYSLKTHYLQLGFAFTMKQQSGEARQCCAVPALLTALPSACTRRASV